MKQQEKEKEYETYVKRKHRSGSLDLRWQKHS